MSYEVERQPEGYRIREPGQQGPGMLVTFGWLSANGFGDLTRSNIDDVIKATMFSAGGGVLQPMTRRPKDMGHMPFPRKFFMEGR